MSEGAAVGWDAAEVAAWATEGGFDGALFEENEIDGGTLFELDVEVRTLLLLALFKSLLNPFTLPHVPLNGTTACTTPDYATLVYVCERHVRMWYR